jgi:8-oxo-dGTP pyrophosphatase MutT (NUDIX family)
MYEFRVTPDSPYHISAGGAVYKIEDGVRRYALLRSHHDVVDGSAGQRWNLPKGTMHSDETLEQCALREIREETGLDVELQTYIGAAHKVFTLDNGWNLDRTVHYFVAQMVGGNTADMDDEHEELVWFTADEARRNLATNDIKREDRFVDRAEQYLAEHAA